MNETKNIVAKVAIVMPFHISERGGGSEVQVNYLAKLLSETDYEIFYICQTIDEKKINKK